MKFLNKFIKTSVDFEGYNSLLIHSLVGCNFKCYQCHNYEELVSKKHTNFYTEKDIVSKLKLNGFMFDAIILSGGEFLINDIEVIKSFLFDIKKVFNGKIIINTNGSFPEKISLLIIMDLVDGFHMDIKFNIWDENDKYKIKVINSNIDNNKLIKSFEIISKYNKGFSEFRTIEYPFIESDYFLKIKNKCESEKIKWKLNKFINLT
jgi:pyruvate-formate lyase-activating enzyme